MTVLLTGSFITPVVHVPGVSRSRRPPGWIGSGSAEETDALWTTPLHRSHDACHHPDLGWSLFPLYRETGIPRALPRPLYLPRRPTQCGSGGGTSREQIQVWFQRRSGAISVLTKSHLQWQRVPVPFSHQADCCSTLTYTQNSSIEMRK